MNTASGIATLVAVCLALGDAGCADVTLPALLRSGPPIQVNESLWLSSEQVTRLLSGRPTGWDSLTTLPSPDSVTAAIQAAFDAGFPMPLVLTNEVSGATEERTSKALGIDKSELAPVCDSELGTASAPAWLCSYLSSPCIAALIAAFSSVRISRVTCPRFWALAPSPARRSFL